MSWMPRLVAVFALLAAAAAQAQPAGGLTPFASDNSLAAYTEALFARWQTPTTTRPVTPGEIQASVSSYCLGESASAAVLKGRVRDASTGDLLIGANVRVLDMDACGAATDVDGVFGLALPLGVVADSAVTVEVSYAGYERTQVEIAVPPGDSAAVEVALGAVQLYDVTVSYEGAPAPSGVMLADESITNNQTAGVDEGGIVKRSGDHLVVLRRGRLFTVAIANGALRPVDAVDASGPDLPGQGTWYDELLILDGTAIVVGYSYARGGTEVVLFDLGANGRLAYRATYHLRSNDYYSAANYASRVVDGRLVFYTPLGLRWRQGADLASWLPGLRRWTGDAQGRFEPVAGATSIYRPARELPRWNAALHTVTSCAVADGALDCDATAVFGPSGHTVYVSGTAVYAWLSRWYDRDAETSNVLYRLPLDGSTPSAIGVYGGPIDQFSFLEAEGALHVVTTDWGGGQWMWNSDRTREALALLRLPLDALGDGAADAPPSWYRRLPVARYGVDQNRFVGHHLLYGADHADDQEGTVQVVDWRTRGTVRSLRTGHAAERIEVLGRHAVVVGSDGDDLRFSAVRLGDHPRLAGSFRVSDAAQGETRSHGFFYRPSGDERGTLGLPIRRWGGRYASLDEGSASVLYLRNAGLRLRRLGTLDATDQVVDDHCVASCVDWYGNARPLFVGDRVFALLGYELVEGVVAAGRIREVGRTTFVPTDLQAVR